MKIVKYFFRFILYCLYGILLSPAIIVVFPLSLLGVMLEVIERFGEWVFSDE